MFFLASISVFVGAAGYSLAQNRSDDSTVDAVAPSTLLAPAEETTTTMPPANGGTLRSTLPPTPSSEVFVYAAGGGCTPGTNRLPDGTYYGSVVINDDRTMDFNLKCLFLAADLPDNFGELFTGRFPGQTFPATGADLVDAAAIDRTVRYTRLSEFVIDGGTYIGDEAAVYYVSRGATPIDVTIVLEDGVINTIVELIDASASPG